MFDRFWEIYPRKVARKDAEKAWAKVPAFKQLEVLQGLRKHIAMWKQQGTEKTFIPYPATYLRGERWEDEIEIAPEMPRCDWNKNGNREVTAGRCEEQAVKLHDGQFYYCAVHCARLGLRALKAVA